MQEPDSMDYRFYMPANERLTLLKQFGSPSKNTPTKYWASVSLFLNDHHFFNLMLSFVIYFQLTSFAIAICVQLSNKQKSFKKQLGITKKKKNLNNTVLSRSCHQLTSKLWQDSFQPTYRFKSW